MNKKQKKILNSISQKMHNRYSLLFDKYGYDIKTLGWGSKKQQNYRFLQSIETGVDFENKKILDLGCGFGDYLDFLEKNSVHFSSYLGVDINNYLIEEAKKQYQKKQNCAFDILDLATINPNEPIADIGVMLGLLNLDLNGEMNNYDYSFTMIKNAFELVNDILIVDFISIKRDISYPKEDHIFYHDPSKVLDFAYRITDNVILKDDYLPIPQKEFMLVFFK
jgi:SAM-dependent methyltransferase